MTTRPALADDCLFCRIVTHDIPSTVVHETDDVLAFRDLNPIAPTHVLVIPKRHIVGADFIVPDDGPVVAAMLIAAKAVADADGIGESGYRTIFNVGPDSGQTVPHLHLHVIGGQPLGWSAR
jgi:histidine triad (HIT) family protein